MKNIEIILTDCIDDIKAGRAELKECLDKYLSVRDQLEPLLGIALSVKQPSDVKTAESFKVRARTALMEHIHGNKRGTNPYYEVVKSWRPAWLKLSTIVVAAVLAISTLTAGTIYASQESLPGELLYSVKMAAEQVQRSFTFNDSKGVEKELSFADKRLEEMQTIVAQARSDIDIALAGYEKNLGFAVSRTEMVREDYLRANLHEQIALTISSHLLVLDDLGDRSSYLGKQYIFETENQALELYIESITGLALVDPNRAAEMNIEVMAGRLQRAKAESEKGNNAGVENALEQYRKLRRLGEDISENASYGGYDTQYIDLLNANATVGQMEILGSIYKASAQEARLFVEQAIETSAEGHYQATNNLEEKGSLGTIPKNPPLPEDLPEESKAKILQQEEEGKPDDGSGEQGDNSGGQQDGGGGSGNGKG